VALAAAVLAVVVLSGCGSTPAASVAARSAHVHGAGSLVFVSGGPSRALGVDNTDLFAAASHGGVRDLTSSSSAERDGAWSADGTHVVFIRTSSTGHDNGSIALRTGVYTWTPGDGAPRLIASCPKYCSQSEFAWSPDDREIAYVSSDRGGPRIDVMNADGSRARTICDPKRCGDSLDRPVWSPDGGKLAFSNGGMGPIGPVDPPSDIWVANADGSGVRKLTQQHCTTSLRTQPGCARDTAPAWSPDGRMIAFSRDFIQFYRGPCRLCKAPPIISALEVMRADGSGTHRLFACKDPYCAQSLGPAWAPDSSAIAYVPRPENRPSFQITTLTGKTSTIRTCADATCVDPFDVVWSPNGKELAFDVNAFTPPSSVWTIGRDGSRLHEVTSGAQCCIAWVGNVPASGSEPAPTPPPAHLHLSGTIAYYTDPGHQPFPSLHLLALASPPHELRVPPIQCAQPAWSPDGSKIACGGAPAGKGTSVRLNDGVRVLTRSFSQPTWSFDGKWLAFTENGPGVTSFDIGEVAADGGSIHTLARGGQAPSWNSDEIVFVRALLPGSKSALYIARSDGPGERRVTNLPGEQRLPAFSPDAKEIAFEWETAGGTGLYLIRRDGTHLRRLTTAPLQVGRPAWSPDGRYLAVISIYGRESRSQVLVIDVKTGRVSPVATVENGSSAPSWSAH
jgi:Tol biopolymer transport system component